MGVANQDVVNQNVVSVKQTVRDTWELTNGKDVVNQGVDGRLWISY